MRDEPNSDRPFDVMRSTRALAPHAATVVWVLLFVAYITATFSYNRQTEPQLKINVSTLFSYPYCFTDDSSGKWGACMIATDNERPVYLGDRWSCPAGQVLAYSRGAPWPRCDRKA